MWYSRLVLGHLTCVRSFVLHDKQTCVRHQPPYAITRVILTTPFKMSDQSDYVTLISSDGYSFIVQRSSACISGAIKRMLDPSCTSIHALHTIVTFIKLIASCRWFRRIKNQHMPFREHQVSRCYVIFTAREASRASGEEPKLT